MMHNPNLSASNAKRMRQDKLNQRDGVEIKQKVFEVVQKLREAWDRGYLNEPVVTGEQLGSLGGTFGTQMLQDPVMSYGQKFMLFQPWRSGNSRSLPQGSNNSIVIRKKNFTESSAAINLRAQGDRVFLDQPLSAMPPVQDGDYLARRCGYRVESNHGLVRIWISF